MAESSVSWADEVKAAVASDVKAPCDDRGPEFRSYRQHRSPEIIVRGAVMNVEETSDSSRSSALSFLSGGMCDGGRYGQQTGEIVGILKHLIDRNERRFACS